MKETHMHMCPHDAHTHTSQFKLVFGATACVHFKIQQSITGQFDYLSPTILVMATEILKKKKNGIHKLRSLERYAAC
jgi:hypothetical protein